MVRIPNIKIPSVRVESIVPTSNIGTGGATPVPPTPITYLTQWKIVGNSEVHTLPYPDGVVLPNGYKRCKYLEFHGTESFNSGIIPEQGIGVSMTFKYLGEYTEEVRDDGFFGCRVSAYSADSLYCFRQAQTDKLLVSYGGKICDSTTIDSFLINADDEIELHLDSNSLSYTNGIDTFAKSHNYQITKGTKTLYIGRINGYGYVSRILLRTFILTNSVGDTIFNGIPCLDDNDVPCLYDIVSGTTLYNQDTGTLGYELYPQPTEIWSCGEYNATDGKYHILVQPLDGSIADIALDEPLRKVNNVADSIEFPSEQEDKILVTRNIKKIVINPNEITDSPFGAYRLAFISDVLSDDDNTIRTLNNLYADVSQADRGQSDVAPPRVYIQSSGVFIRGTEVQQQGGNVSAYKQELIDFYANGGTFDVLYALATPTTELVDAPQIEEADSYTCVISQGAKAVSWSSFETDSE